MAQEYTDTSDAVLEAEKDYIREDYKEIDAIGSEQKQEFSGLALSGGGIRSASFCLGIIQALVAGGVLKKIDYLSTASGGGYMGTALTWFLKQPLQNGKPAGTDVENFPLGRAHTGACNQKRNPNAALDFLRQHGSYLTPGNGLDFVSCIGYLIRTILVSFLVYFTLMTSALTLLKVADFLFQPPFPYAGKPLMSVPNWYWLGAIVIVGFFVVLSISYNLITCIPLGSTAWRYRFRAYSQIILGLLIKSGIALLVLGSLPIIHGVLARIGMHIETASATTLLGTFMGWLQYYREQKKPDEGMPKGSNLNSIIAAILIIYGLLLGAYILSNYIDRLESISYAFAWVIMLLVVGLLGVCVNVNYTSLHRMYRDRLMEAFMPNAESVSSNQWDFSEEADKALIETMCQPPNRRPYHLINANLVLADSETAKYRSRGGDSFILSRLYCGSDATGWRKSSHYMMKGSRGMTLASAMAISGAALNPNAANNGRGLGRNRWVSILYTLLNLRLGYWTINPRKERRFSPNFISPCLIQGIISKGLKETKKVIELSDGGHFENLALYELVRRKLKVIISCDGGADGLFTFADLGNAIEKVRVDFGAKIVFDDPELDLPDILPKSSASPIIAAKYQTAKRGFAVATIYYADGSQGKLVYIKATMIECLSTDIYSYKSACPTFPHEPTVDQFFDEVQIEAYRELGYYLAWQMLEMNGGVARGEKIDPTKPGRWI